MVRYIKTNPWMSQTLCGWKKQQEKGRYKLPLSTMLSVALSNPLHSLLSFYRHCKDTIVLTVLQPHQVLKLDHTLLSCSSPSGFLSVLIGLNTFFFLPQIPQYHLENMLFSILFWQCTQVQGKQKISVQGTPLCFLFSARQFKVRTLEAPET